MHIDVISLFPAMFNALNYGIVGRAIEHHLIALTYWNPRDFTSDKHRTVDDKPYGGGPGMIMLAEPLLATIQAIKQQRPHSKIIYLSPQGTRFQQTHAQILSHQSELTLLAGRYEGIDERVIVSAVDEQYSIGDYILSGGEFAAMVMIDAITRLLPGALGDAESAQQDSFSTGLLEYPHYTRPACINNLDVPAVLLSGNHQAIAQWRLQQALVRTYHQRPDLLKAKNLSKMERFLLEQALSE
ncbi:MAG: tRNA (guanosine(37)-N1)-methyltransferase TrmD [Gammaproteobacteria bacterium]